MGMEANEIEGMRARLTAQIVTCHLPALSTPLNIPISTSQTTKPMMTTKKSRSKSINTTSPRYSTPKPQLGQLQRPETCPLPGWEKTLRRECEPRFSDRSSRWLALSPSYNICNKSYPLYLFKRCNKKYVQSPSGDWKLKLKLDHIHKRVCPHCVVHSNMDLAAECKQTHVQLS